MTEHDVRADVELESYLLRLAAELATVPELERSDILMETRSHVAERIRRAPATTVQQVLVDLGPPEEYAHRFLPDASMSTAEPGTLGDIAALATGGWLAMPLLLLVMLAYAIAGLWVIVALIKIGDPAGTGVWVDRTSGHLVSAGLGMKANVDAREVIGYWLVPICLGIAYGIHRAIAALLRRVRRNAGRTTGE